ncbi:hypothetical protein J6590_068121 [Homalodisca vitripennis]|nr:hypothetical protein J6590_068121 [Homalodisca vitripennis]
MITVISIFPLPSHFERHETLGTMKSMFGESSPGLHEKVKVLNVMQRVNVEFGTSSHSSWYLPLLNMTQDSRSQLYNISRFSRYTKRKLQPTFLFVQRMGSDAVTNLTPRIWSDMFV